MARVRDILSIVLGWLSAPITPTISLTLQSRSVALTLDSRSAALTLPSRSAALTLEER